MTTSTASEGFHTMLLRETVMQIKFLMQQGVAKSRIAVGAERRTCWRRSCERAFWR